MVCTMARRPIVPQKISVRARGRKCAGEQAQRTGERELITGRARMHYSRAPDLTGLSAFFGLETRLSATWRAAGLRDAMGGRRGNHRQRARYRRLEDREDRQAAPRPKAIPNTAKRLGVAKAPSAAVAGARGLRSNSAPEENPNGTV